MRKRKKPRHKTRLGAPEPVSEEKTVNNCFFKRCPIKQGAEGARVSSDAQGLCDSDVRTHVSNVGLEYGSSHKRKRGYRTELQLVIFLIVKNNP